MAALRLGRVVNQEELKKKLFLVTHLDVLFIAMFFVVFAQALYLLPCICYHRVTCYIRKSSRREKRTLSKYDIAATRCILVVLHKGPFYMNDKSRRSKRTPESRLDAQVSNPEGRLPMFFMMNHSEISLKKKFVILHVHPVFVAISNDISQEENPSRRLTISLEARSTGVSSFVGDQMDSATHMNRVFTARHPPR